MIPSMNNILFLIVAGVFIISCQSIELVPVKSQCENIDWYEIGRGDAVQGKTSQSYKKTSEQCIGFSSAQEAQYFSGWNAGLDSFCTRQQGFVLGRLGNTYENICPENKIKSFQRGYEQGLKVFNYEQNNKVLAEELQATSQRVEKSSDSEKQELFRKINQLETQLELNRALIAEIQKDIDSKTRVPSRTF